MRKQQPSDVLGPVKIPPSNYQNGVPSPFAPIFVDTGNIKADNFQYLNPYTRWKFNYVRAFLEDTHAGNSLTNLYGMRFDYDF